MPRRRRTTIPDAPKRGRAALGLLATTLLPPLALLLLGLWEAERGAADLDAAEAHRQRTAQAVSALQARVGPGVVLDVEAQFRRGGQVYVGSLALAQAREELDDAGNNVALARVRRYLPPFVVLPAGAVAGLSALVLLAGALLARRGRASREALVRGFSLLRRVLPPVLGAQVVLAAVAVTAATGFEASALLFADQLSGGEAKMLLLAALFVGACLFVAGGAVLGLRRALAAFDPAPLPVAGRPVSRAEAPGLWRLLDELAERLGALRPDAVVVGLTGGFFVGSGAKVLEPGGAALAGRTLYLPLPYLPLLRGDEVAAIVAHELAHFSGGDTEYSLRFLPVYAGVGRSLDALAAAGSDRGSDLLLLRPALRLGVFVLDGFHRAVRHWSRVREFAADAAGAGATSPDAAARALLRTSALRPRIEEALHAAAQTPDAAPDDLVAAALRHAEARGPDDPSGVLEDEQPHPTDTHPPTRQRLAALGRAPTPALLAEAAAPPGPDAPGRLREYFAEPEAVCRAATADFLALVRQDAQALREELEAAVAGVGTEARALHENTRGGGLFLIGAGAVIALMALGAMALDIHGLDSREEWITIGAGFGLALFFIACGAFTLRRGDKPFLVLRPEAMAIPGLSVPIAWEHVADLDMTLHTGRMSTRVLLSPGAPFPARLPGARRVRLDAKRRIVTLTAGLPRGMKAQGFADRMADYPRAAEGRRRLAAEGVGPGGDRP